MGNEAVQRGSLYKIWCLVADFQKVCLADSEENQNFHPETSREKAFVYLLFG